MVNREEETKVSKLRFCLDLDGVCFRWDKGVRTLLKQEFDLVLPERESPHWNYVDSCLSAEEKKWLWSVGINSGMYTLGGMYPNTTEAVHLLDQQTYLFVVTTRPLAADSITQWQVKNKLGIEPERVFFVEPLAKATYEAEVYLDDNPHELTYLVNQAPKWAMILGWKRRWNESEWNNKDILWVDSWLDVMELIKED